MQGRFTHTGETFADHYPKGRIHQRSRRRSSVNFRGPMSTWLLRRDDHIVLKVAEVRFTLGAVKLHRVAIALSAGPQQFVSQAVSACPVDPVSHRYKARWPDSALRIPLQRGAPTEATLTIYDRRRRVRTAIGTVTIPLTPRERGVNTFVETFRLSNSMFSALNIKIDVEIGIRAPQEIIDEWWDTAPEPSATAETLRQSISPPSIIHPPLKELSSTVADFDSDISSSVIPDRIQETASANHLDSSTISLVPSSLPTSSAATLVPHYIEDIAPAKHSMGPGGLGFDINSETVGVTFLEVQSISNLPRFRTLTGLSFDMDPFVVVSFGQRTFRTPYRRHTTNPTFNSKLVIEVGKHEKSFDIIFDVWDKDRITLNDRVAQARLPLPQVVTKGPTCDEKTKLYNLDTYEPETVVLPLHLASESAASLKSKRSASLISSELMLRVHYYPLAAIRQQLWRGVIGLYGTNSNGLQRDQLCAMLNSLGSTLKPSTIDLMFTHFHKDPAKDTLEPDEIVAGLEALIQDGTKLKGDSERVILFRVCPFCQRSPSEKQYSQTRSLLHISVCASRHWGGMTQSAALLDSCYVSPQQASRRWYVSFLSKFSYGSYELGAHSANILVQDRRTGEIHEERMSAYVRLGIRAIYATGPVRNSKFKKLLRKYTLKHGIKYSSPSSAAHIRPFIRFHHLDMSDVLEPVSSFKTFNEFFYRKLKKGARPCENSEEPRTVVSCADCRLTVFKSVNDATSLWIKGKSFTVEKLLGPSFKSEAAKYSNNNPVLVFRLAPQDYHRFHVPVDGVVGEAVHIPGEYYTVNPMAVRSKLDVFGNNARTIVPIESPIFGRVMMVMVGAMMVGSIVITAEPGSTVQRTDELGYFQFGGSTIVLLFEENKIQLDSDLLANSDRAIETLVRVGMSVGHTNDISEYSRMYDTRWTTIKRARTQIEGGGAYLPFSLD